MPLVLILGHARHYCFLGRIGAPGGNEINGDYGVNIFLKQINSSILFFIVYFIYVCVLHFKILNFFLKKSSIITMSLGFISLVYSHDLVINQLYSNKLLK